MSSKAWSIVRDVFPVKELAVATAAGVETRLWQILPDNIPVEILATATAAGIAIRIWRTLPDNIHALLHKRQRNLTHLNEYINDLSQDQRECVRIAAQQGKCSSLEQLECKSRGLFRYGIELMCRVGKTNFLGRILPASHSKLWGDINRLEDEIKALRHDAWHFTEENAEPVQTGVLPMSA